MFYSVVQFCRGFVFQVHTALFCLCFMGFREGAVHKNIFFSFFIKSLEDFWLELFVGCYSCFGEAI